MSRPTPHPHLAALLLALLLLAACTPGKTSTSQAQVTTITDPGQQTSITYKEDLTLVIPPDSVPAGSQVSISSVKGAPDFEYSGARTLAVYEVKMGDQVSFTWPLKIQLQYDPAKLDVEIAPADQLIAAYLDESSGRWVETDFMLDKATSTLTISTDHLSLWGLFGLEDHVVVSTSPHFKIYFDDRLNAPMLGKQVSGAGLMYDFAAQVRSALEDAYTAYDQAPGGAGDGFRMPTMTKVYIDDWGPEKTAEWGWFSKSIEIPTSYSNLAELNQDVAHELFHAIQNQVVDVVTMHSNRWLMEASADYAAAAIGTANGLKTEMELDFIKKPLTDPEDNHMYRVAHFLQYMNGQGLGFKELVDVFSTGMDGLGALEGFTQAKGQDLQDVYTDFASAFIFGNSLQRKPLPTGSPSDLADYKGTYSKVDTRLATVVDIPGEYAARLVAYEITDGASVAPYKAYLSMLDESSLVQVRYYVVTEGLMDSGDLTSGQPVEVEVKGGTLVYFLVTNANENQGTATVVLEQKPAALLNSYSGSNNALIYNQDFTGIVGFTISSTAAFEVVREAISDNQELIFLDLRIPDLSKGAEIYVEGSVNGIGMKDQAEHSNLTASVADVQWYVTGVGEVPGGSANASMPANSKEGLSLRFSVFINCFNSLSGSTSQCGSATVVSISIGP